MPGQEPMWALRNPGGVRLKVCCISSIKELGGTGRAHDWRLSRRIRDAVDVPVFLAGGLTPENVGSAVSRVRPFGVDVCTGVRTAGRLDPEKLNRFAQGIPR